MSYNPLRNQDSISELISVLNDFNQISYRILEAIESDDFNDFSIWTQKAKDIDARSLYFFTLHNKNKLNKKQKKFLIMLLGKNPFERIDLNEFIL